MQELEAARESGKGGADAAHLQAENTRLKARIAALEATVKRSRFSEDGYIMPEKQFTDLRRCLHPDVIAFMETVAKDNPALQPKIEPLIKQLQSGPTLNEFKDVLVNRPARKRKRRRTHAGQ